MILLYVCSDAVRRAVERIGRNSGYIFWNHIVQSHPLPRVQKPKRTRHYTYRLQYRNGQEFGARRSNCSDGMLLARCCLGVSSVNVCCWLSCCGLLLEPTTQHE
jgi:hypothetical protein